LTLLRVIAFVCLLLFPSKISHKHTKASLKQVYCLATAMYRESLSEGINGRLGVASVALKRASLDIDGHSIDVCSVISKRGQFTWWNKSPYVLTKDELGDILYDAHIILEQYKDRTFTDVTNNATHFVTKGTRNYWTQKFKHTVTIGNLEFYRER